MSAVPQQSAPSSWSENFPPSPQWTARDIPDLQGKVCVVTGGYGGIGFETTVSGDPVPHTVMLILTYDSQKALVEHSGKVYILGRSETAFKQCLDRLSSMSTSASEYTEPKFIPCDLSSISSTKVAAKHLLSLEPTVHLLFCSAGIAYPPYGSTSNDGYELIWHTNVMGHFLLLQSLRPSLENAFDQSGEKARVVWTSSFGLNTAPRGGVDFDSLKVDGNGKSGNGMYRQPLYGQVSDWLG